MEFYWMIVVSAMNIALPYAITRYDRKRLGAVELSRAWNMPSWACAIYFFGPLSLPAHFFVTRRTFRGLALGALMTVLVLGVEWLVGLALDALA